MSIAHGPKFDSLRVFAVVNITGPDAMGRFEPIRAGSNRISDRNLKERVSDMRNRLVTLFGGGGFLVYRPNSGDPTTFDFREAAPAGSHPELRT